MEANTEAVELLRQIAEDTRATREAVEALAKKPASDASAEAITRALAEISKAQSGRAPADYIALVHRQ